MLPTACPHLDCHLSATQAPSKDNSAAALAQHHQLARGIARELQQRQEGRGG
jgi:hypothetical protein